jgi:hypothetical protein
LETSVSFADWVKNGWLVAHKSSKQEIANLLGIVARDLKDSQAKDVSDDWRFAIVYNAALQAATAALAAAGIGDKPHSVETVAAQIAKSASVPGLWI